MRSFNVKISTQVFIGFGLVTVLLVLLAASAWFSLGNIDTDFRRFSRIAEQESRVLTFNGTLLQTRAAVFYFETKLSPELQKAAEESFAQAARDLDALDGAVASAEKKASVGRLRENFHQYELLFKKATESRLAAKAEGDRIFETMLTPVFAPVQEAANQTIDQTLIGHADSSLKNALNAKVFITRFLDTVGNADMTEASRYLTNVREELAQLAKLSSDPTLIKATSDASKFLDDYMARIVKFHRLIDTAEEASGQRTVFASNLAKETHAFAEHITQEQQRLASGAADTMAQSQTFLAVISLASVLIAAGAAVFIGRRISQPLSLVAGVINEISVHKDLVQRVNYDAANEIGRITKGFNELMGNLHDAFEGIARNTRQVAAAAGQASSAVGQVSDGSQNQLNAIGQISAAMEQTARAITDVAGNTDQATAHARKAADLVEHGRDKMSAMLEVANTISDNSKKINQITDVISRIANQTNMLSLNAAIEAARAGEHGKGFAVVAEEVRKLAEHAATSVQQITELVEHAAGEAQRSLEMVNAVNADMESIADSVRRSDAMIQGIAAAMTQQSSSVEEITANVKNLNKIGETNAAAAEEITATMVELARLADQTRGQMEQFRI